MIHIFFPFAYNVEKKKENIFLRLNERARECVEEFFLQQPHLPVRYKGENESDEWDTSAEYDNQAEDPLLIQRARDSTGNSISHSYPFHLRKVVYGAAVQALHLLRPFF